MNTAPITVVIPTYRREKVLLETVSHLLNLPTRAESILVIDQTERHLESTEESLQSLHDANQIQWIRLSTPSITKSMNLGLKCAKSPLVLFLDDDIRPVGDLIAAHAQTHHASGDLWATVGQVLQPWDTPQSVDAPQKLSGLRKDFDFPFYSTVDSEVTNVMAGNLCVSRERALQIGGFDERFQGSAYRFETEFARRITRARGRIRFVGQAGIHHLRATEGGTRAIGSHLRSSSPEFGYGDYYYAYKCGVSSTETLTYCLSRLIREVRTFYHLTHPWWIPVKLLGEIRAWRKGRRLAIANKPSNSNFSEGISNAD